MLPGAQKKGWERPLPASIVTQLQPSSCLARNISTREASLGNPLLMGERATTEGAQIACVNAHEGLTSVATAGNETQHALDGVDSDVNLTAGIEGRDRTELATVLTIEVGLFNGQLDSVATERGNLEVDAARLAVIVEASDFSTFAGDVAEAEE